MPQSPTWEMRRCEGTPESLRTENDQLVVYHSERDALLKKIEVSEWGQQWRTAHKTTDAMRDRRPIHSAKKLIDRFLWNVISGLLVNVQQLHVGVPNSSVVRPVFPKRIVPLLQKTKHSGEPSRPAKLLRHNRWRKPQRRDVLVAEFKE